MSHAVDLYAALTEAPDEKARAKIIAEALERFEEQYPRLPDMATQGHVREAGLRLQKEIEQVRKEIEQVRKETEQMRADLRTEIEQVRANVIKWVVGVVTTNTVVIVAAMLGGFLYIAG